MLNDGGGRTIYKFALVMSVTVLEKYLPAGTLPYLKNWFGNHYIHIKITKGRQSKLGDYLRLRDGTHQITLNSTMPPQLFFFVLTHELAHLIAFAVYGRKILPHGAEWKKVYRAMLYESLAIYSEDLQPVIFNYAKNPKANFMASPDLVRYFDVKPEGSQSIFLENLAPGMRFAYRGKEYILEEKLKKNYLCADAANGRKYLFKAVAKVEKIV